MSYEYLESLWDSVSDSIASNSSLAAVAGAGAVALLGTFYFWPTSTKDKPRTNQLTGGGIHAKEVKKEFDDYASSYGKQAGEGIMDRSKTGELVDTFYNLVTGCGVGGPMRTIASTSGAEVTGITINNYQVQRGIHHNTKLGVTGLCKPTQGDFLHMQFPDNSFDAAYAIEATCHAAKLEEVYAEIGRVLKPGSLFASYEWVATKDYNPENARHVQIIDEINFGNGLPEMRTYREAEAAGKAAGLQLVTSIDIAVASSVAGPWYHRLEWLQRSSIIRFNSAIVWFFSRLGLAPRGMEDVHNMLVKVATSLVAGGSTGVFSPMHLLVFRKPAENAGEAADHISA